MYFRTLKQIKRTYINLSINMFRIRLFNSYKFVKESRCNGRISRITLIITSLSWITNSMEKGHLCLVKSGTNHERMTLAIIFQFSFRGLTSLMLWLWFGTSQRDMLNSQEQYWKMRSKKVRIRLETYLYLHR